MESILNRVYGYLEAELRSERLQKIPKTVYRDIASYIKETRNLADENGRNLVSNLVRRERDLLARLAVRLLQVRLEKVSAHMNEEANGMNLTPEEKYLIEPSSTSHKRFDKLSRALMNGQTAVLGNVSDLVSSRYVVVRFLQSASSLIGVDLAKYGPFKKEDVTVLPLDNAKPLLRQGVVQEVDLEV
ncbi:MAG: hypothetical protein ACE5KU_05850 [Nitrososphaerales archaeon]